MAKQFLLIFYLFMLVRLGEVASISTEAYWKLKLPKTLMPESVQKSLAPIGIDKPRKGLRPTAKESLATIQGYGGLLSYNNPKYLSYIKQVSDSSNNGYHGFSSDDKKSLDSENNPKYYNKEGLENTQGGYGALLSYKKTSLDSENPNYLSYNNKDGLETTQGGYGALLSYKKMSLDSENPNYLSYNNKQGLETTQGGYGALLSYKKTSLDSENPEYLSYNNKQGLETTQGGYGALLSYKKTSLDSENPEYLSYNNKQGLENTQGGYGALLSYRKTSLDSENPEYLSYNNKEGLKTTQGGYGALLSYKKATLDSENPEYLSYNNKQGLENTQGGYGALLSYKKTSLDSENPNDLSKNNQGLETTQGGYGALLSYRKTSLESENQHGLDSKESTHVDHDANSSETEDQVFFVEKDLHVGTKKTLHFHKSTRKGLFLPRKLSDQIPFTSKNVQETLQILSLDPESHEAYVLSKRIELCEEPTIEGVEKKCVTSLESMVDYVISKLGTNDLKSLTTQVEKDYPEMEYTIKGVKKLVKDDRETVVCHKMGYPYAVFFCHRTTTIRSYMVSLVGDDGTKIEAIAACHKESNDFLDNYAKNVLHVVPGSTRICHFPPAEDTLIWVPKY